jgi:hypothetical protein
MDLTKFTTLEEFDTALMEAKQSEYVAREDCYTIDRKDIGGIWVKPLTLRMYTTLQRTNNIILKGRYTPADLINFLFICHVDSGVSLNKAEHERIINQVRNQVKNWLEVKTDLAMAKLCLQHYHEAMLDSGYSLQASKDNVTNVVPKVNVSSTARIVFALAKEFGWSTEYILERPLSEVWQYMRQIAYEASCSSADLAYSEENESDEILSALLAFVKAQSTPPTS